MLGTPDISIQTLAFDDATFATTYAAELAAESDANTWLTRFQARKTALGAGFESDDLCQSLCGQIEIRKLQWDRKRAAATWKAANPTAHADWMSTNAALNAAGADGKRDT
jgi:hypothetical protein